MTMLTASEYIDQLLREHELRPEGTRLEELAGQLRVSQRTLVPAVNELVRFVAASGQGAGTNAYVLKLREHQEVVLARVAELDQLVLQLTEQAARMEANLTDHLANRIMFGIGGGGGGPAQEPHVVVSKNTAPTILVRAENPLVPLHAPDHPGADTPPPVLQQARTPEERQELRLRTIRFNHAQ